MRRRVYFLLPNVKRAKQAMRELLLARIEERHIHVLAKPGTDVKDLPEATLLQKSDFVHGVEQGLFVGLVTGSAAGLLLYNFPPDGLAVGGGGILALGLLGAAFGAWASGMIASATPNTQLRSFWKEIEKGQVLMMVDVPKEKVEEVSRMIRKHYPEADLRGVEPTIPVFP